MKAYRVGMAALSVLALSLPFWVGPVVMDLARERHPLHPSRVPPPIEGRVLLVGDSCFHGVGAEAGQSFAEKMGLERRTGTRLHSVDALRKLPGWLGVDRPSTVLIGLGADESALKPQLWTESEAEILSDWIGRRSDASQADFIGEWIGNGTPIEFESTGRARVGGLVGSWTFDGERLSVSGGGAEAVWVPKIEGELLILASLDGEGAQIECVPKVFSESQEQRAMRSIDEGHLTEWDLREPGASRGSLPKPAFDLAKSFVETLRGKRESPWPPSYATVTPLDDAARARFEQSLVDLIQAVRRVGATPILLGHAEAFQDRDEIARAVAERMDVPFVSAPEKDSTGPRLVHEEANGYWTEAGHARWIQALAPFLKRSVVRDR